MNLIRIKWRINGVRDLHSKSVKCWILFRTSLPETAILIFKAMRSTTNAWITLEHSSLSIEILSSDYMHTHATRESICVHIRLVVLWDDGGIDEETFIRRVVVQQMVGTLECRVTDED